MFRRRVTRATGNMNSHKTLERLSTLENAGSPEHKGEDRFALNRAYEREKAKAKVA